MDFPKNDQVLDPKRLNHFFQFGRWVLQDIGLYRDAISLS